MISKEFTRAFEKVAAKAAASLGSVTNGMNKKNENPLKVPKNTGVKAAKPGIQHTAGYKSGGSSGF